MRILLVSGLLLAPALESLGHEVRLVYPPAGAAPVASLLEGFRADLLVQQESLGPRTMLLGLPQAPCPTVFWSIDGHQNYFWHRHYARLFDGALFSQPEIASGFRQGGGRSAWLPWCGREQPWAVHAQRPLGLGFVGRMAAERPARNWFLERLRAYGLHLRDDLAPAELPGWYAGVRVAPNEAILGEINFRLFEAASAGCAVLTPRFAPEQRGLFEPGREVLEYDDVLELEDLLRFLARRPEAGESVGRAAWERVRREHLPAHRAAALLDFAAGLPSGSRDLRQGRACELLTLAELRRGGRLDMPLEPLLAGLADCAAVAGPAPADVVAMRIRLLAENGRMAEALALAQAAAATGDQRREVLQAGSAAALQAGDLPLARHLLAAYTLARGRTLAGQSPADVLTAWARELARHDAVLSAGFAFDPQGHLPATAAECLLLAGLRAPDDLEITRRLDQLLEGRRGFEPTRLGLLSHLTLHRRQDWRLGLRLAKVNLRAFRRDEGLAELALARQAAEAAGEERQFERMCAGLGVGPGRTAAAG